MNRPWYSDSILAYISSEKKHYHGAPPVVGIVSETYHETSIPHEADRLTGCVYTQEESQFSIFS